MADIKAPLYEAVLKYRDESNVLLHMPGHKGGQGFTIPELRSIGSLDFTEIPGLDDLHLPRSAIKKAQDLAAEAWGAKASVFLVNGATSGIHSLFMALGEKKKVLVPRNAHRSFLGGMILSGVEPVYVECLLDPDLKVAVSVNMEDFINKIRAHQDLAAVFAVSPSYYGTVADIEAMVDLLQHRGIPLVVDEAHGGHLAFHPALPRPALEKGAAACVHGLHKNTPVLTQAGIMHFGQESLYCERARQCHDHLTTTSPSYPLMLSLDLGRALLQLHGCSLLEEAINRSRELRQVINGIPGLVCRETEFCAIEGVIGYDPLKILVEVRGVKASGLQLAYDLRRKYRIQVEMAQENFILALFSIFNRADDWNALGQALQDWVRGNFGKPAYSIDPGIPPIPPAAMTPREAFLSECRNVKIKDAVGLISSEMAAAYPPGIPCLMPGEIITHEVVDYISGLVARGIVIHGLADRSGLTINVVKNERTNS